MDIMMLLRLMGDGLHFPDWHVIFLGVQLRLLTACMMARDDVDDFNERLTATGKI